MTRKAAWCGLPFLAGTFLFCTVGQYHFFLFAAAAALLCMFAVLIFKDHRVYAAAVGISVLCGLSCAEAYTLLRISPALALDGKNVTVSGTVTDSRYMGSEKWALTVSGKADGTDCTVIFYADRSCEPYDNVVVSGELTALENTASFPSKTYYLPKGIYLSGQAETLKLTGSRGSPFMRTMTSLRSYTQKCIFAETGSRSAPFLEALICGDKSDMDTVTKTGLYRSGVGHMFAVSGTHIAIVAMFMGAVYSLFIRSARIRTLLLCVTVLAFAAFGGFSPSLTRAAVMTVLVCCSSAAGRRTDCLSSLGICSVLMCGTQPFCCISPSFICSFAACFAIGAVAPRLNSRLGSKPLAFITVPFVDTLVILTVVMPFQLILFPSVSLIAPVAGLLIVPLCSAALMLTVLAMLTGGVSPVSHLCFMLADLAVRAALKLSGFFSSLDFAAVGTRSVWLILAGASVMGGALCYAVICGKIKAFVLCSAGTFIAMWSVQTLTDVLDRSIIRMKLFSNGKDLCAVISSCGECTVLDLGTKAGYSYAVSEYISKMNIRRVRSVFTEGDLGAMQYRYAICPQPERIFSEYGEEGSLFREGMTAEMFGCSITRTDSGFCLDVNGRTYSMTKKQITLQDGGYLPAEELKKYPELIIEK